MDLLDRTAAVPTGRTLTLVVGFLSMSLLGGCSDGDSPASPGAASETAEDSTATRSASRELPETVTDLSVASKGIHSVTLEWASVDDGAGDPAAYQVRFARTPIGDGWDDASVVVEGECASPITSSKVGATVSCTVEGLEPATSYDFQLVAFREKKNGKRVYSENLSNVVSAETYTGVPDAVGDLSAPGATSSSITLGWTEVADGAGSPALYEVRYTVSSESHSWDGATVVGEGSCGAPVAGSEIGATRTCTVGGLPANAGYDFQLAAFREKPDGSRVYSAELSNVVAAETAAGLPGTVRDFSVTGVTSTSATLEWTAVDDGAGAPALYELRRAPTPIGSGWSDAEVVTEGECAVDPAAVEVGTTITCTATGLASDTSHDFQLVAYREEDEGSRVYADDLSNVATGVTPDDLTGDSGTTDDGTTDDGGGTGSYPYEPADFTPITETSYASATEDGWAASTDLSLVDDSSAPWSPAPVGQAHYPAGWTGGYAPIWSERGISSAGARRLYVSFWLKVSGNWQGHSVNDKILYLWTHEKPVVFPVYVGGGGNPLHTEIRIQDVPDGARNLVPNRADPRIDRGRWHRWEIVVTSNSGDSADGEIHWWIDGTKVGEYHDVRFGTTSQSKIWNYVSWRPVWGGSGGEIQQDQYMWMDHTYVSGAP